jgi:hypothetical protein
MWMLRGWLAIEARSFYVAPCITLCLTVMDACRGGVCVSQLWHRDVMRREGASLEDDPNESDGERWDRGDERDSDDEDGAPGDPDLDSGDKGDLFFIGGSDNINGREQLLDPRHRLLYVKCRVASCRLVSSRVVSCRLVSSRVVSCRLVPCRVVSCRVSGGSFATRFDSC